MLTISRSNSRREITQKSVSDLPSQPQPKNSYKYHELIIVLHEDREYFLMVWNIPEQKGVAQASQKTHKTLFLYTNIALQILCYIPKDITNVIIFKNTPSNGLKGLPEQIDTIIIGPNAPISLEKALPKSIKNSNLEWAALPSLKGLKVFYEAKEFSDNYMKFLSSSS